MQGTPEDAHLVITHYGSDHGVAVLPLGAAALALGQLAGTDHAADTLGLLFRQSFARRQARVRHGLGSSYQTVFDEGIHRFGFFGRKIYSYTN